MCLVSIACIFQALYDTCQKIKNRSRKSQVMGWKRTAFFVRRLKKCYFSIPILTTCLQSVIAPKRIDRFWCAWCQSLAFSKLYMIHNKKSKIEQEIAELWGSRRDLTLSCPAPYFVFFVHTHYLNSHFFCNITMKTISLNSLIISEFRTFFRS